MRPRTSGCAGHARRAAFHSDPFRRRLFRVLRSFSRAPILGSSPQSSRPVPDWSGPGRNRIQGRVVPQFRGADIPVCRGPLADRNVRPTKLRHFPRTRARAMADFSLLPPRPAVGEELARLVRPYLPGVSVSADECARFLAQLVEAAGGGAVLVHREDVPDGVDPAEALRDGFGAEDGDRLIHVSLGARPSEPRVKMLAFEEPVLT